MKRIVLCAALVMCLGGTSGATPAPMRSLTVGSLAQTAAAKTVGASFNIAYTTVGQYYTGVVFCAAKAHGGTAVFVKISRCFVTSSGGGIAQAPVVIVPGPQAITAGPARVHKGALSGCVTATARFLDGSQVTRAYCAPF